MANIATAIGLEATYHVLRLEWLDRTDAYQCCLAFVLGYNWRR